MESGRHGAKSLLQKPAVRIGAVVLVVHAICWYGWGAINPGANNANHGDIATAQHERIRAAVEAKD